MNNIQEGWESLPDISISKFLAVFDVLKEYKVSNARDRFTVEVILFSKGSDERLHVFQTQSGHSLFIIGYEDHLKEVNELVIRNALELISASSFLWRGS